MRWTRCHCMARRPAGNSPFWGAGTPSPRRPGVRSLPAGRERRVSRGLRSAGRAPRPSAPTLLARLSLLSAAGVLGGLGAGVEQQVLGPQQLRLAGEAVAGGLELDLVQQHLRGRGAQQPAQRPGLARVPPRFQQLPRLRRARHGVSPHVPPPRGRAGLSASPSPPPHTLPAPPPQVPPFAAVARARLGPLTPPLAFAVRSAPRPEQD